jgi:hypothetical protein
MKKSAALTFVAAVLLSSTSYAQTVNNATVNQVAGIGSNSSYVSQAGFLRNNASVGQAALAGQNRSGIDQNTSFFGVNSAGVGQAVFFGSNSSWIRQR